MRVKVLENCDDPYNEIPQTADVKFAPIGIKGGKLYQTHPLFKCKDYFNEVVVATRTGDTHEQYGFEYNPNNIELSEGCQFLLRTTKIDLIKQGINNILNPLEKEAGIQLTTFTDEGNNTLHIVADPRWYQETYTISILTFILRSFWYLDTISEKPLSEFLLELHSKNLGVDTGHLRELGESVVKVMFTNCIKYLDKILTTDEVFKDKVKEANDNFLHNSGGMVGITYWLIKGEDSNCAGEPMCRRFFPNSSDLKQYLYKGV